MHILRRSLLSAGIFMIKHLICGWRAGIMQADRRVKFMGHLKRILDVSCLKYPFPIGSNKA